MNFEYKEKPMKKIVNIRLSVVLLAFLALMVSGYGQIKVSYVGGEAYFTRNNLRQRITHGMEIKPGDMITTAKRSFVALLFDDGSVHKVTANSQYEIKNYRNTDKSRFQVFNIIKGKIFSFVSKTFKKSDIKFLTPTAVVGVRGTTFVTYVDPLSGESEIWMIEGKIDLESRFSGQKQQVNGGEKSRATRNGEMTKEAMSESDYKEAAKDIPTSLADIESDTSQEDGSGPTASSEEDNNLMRQLADEATERIDEQRDEIVENKIWDHQSRKNVGNFRIFQAVTQPENNQVLIINHTVNTLNNKQNSLRLGLVFEQAIPNVDDVIAGTTRNAKEVNWEITVSDGGNKDELYYSKNYTHNSQYVSFNQEEGDNIVSKDLNIKGANVRIPTLIQFAIDGKTYKFDLDYHYINSDESYYSGVVLDREKNYNTYEKILSGDLDTRITIKATLPDGHKANVLNDGDSFKIILINDFLFPLFNKVSS